MRQYLLLPIVIATVIIIAFFARVPPASTGNSGFDVARAKADVAELARAPRPAGSAENARAKDWLVSRFQALGLEVQTQSGIGVRQAKFDKRRKGTISISPYENVIAVLPGRDRSKEAIALMAHYDSVPFANGASDDAAGVATQLETARLLASGQRPLRDTVFLVTDAEEVGLIGAQMFFDTHPLAKRIGAVINVEARGSRGRAIMFQTSNGNGALIDLWAKNAVHPTGNSMANGVYQRLPNDTDLSVSLDKGIIGINAAFIDGLADYHMPTDSAANLDSRSLGDIGAFAVTTMRALANADALPARAGEAAYFDVFGWFVIRYPLVLGWGLIALGAVGLAFGGIAKLGVNWAQAARATLGVLGITFGTGAFMHFAMQWMSGTGTIALRDRINEMDGAVWIFIAMVAGAILVARPRAGMWVGGIIVTLIFALAAQIWLPGGSWIFIWAALLGIVLLFVASRIGMKSPWLIFGSALLGGLWGALLLEGLITTYMTVAPMTPAPMVLIIPLALSLIGPVLADASFLKLGRKVGISILVAAALGFIWIAATDHFSARHPKPADMFYVRDNVKDKGWWATTSSARHLPAGDSVTLKPKGFETVGWKAVAAPVTPVVKPVFTLTENAGRMRLTVTSEAPPILMSLSLKPSKTLKNAQINGKPVRIGETQATRISWRAETANAQIVLEFDKDVGGQIAIDYLYALPGLPPGAPIVEGVPTDWVTLNQSRTYMGSEKLPWP